MDEVDFIRRALDDATTLIETKYADRTELSHREKETSDRLTEADVEIQRLLVQHIDIHYPTDAIVGEESGFDRGIEKGPERCWIIDPIDGTYNFTRDLFPVFGVSIACAERGLPVAAGIALPGLQQLYLAGEEKEPRAMTACCRYQTRESLCTPSSASIFPNPVNVIA